MDKNDKNNVSKYRISFALELLEISKANIDIDTRTSINRSYYAIYTAMRAVLALDGFDSKKHTGTISEFRIKYIKTGTFNNELSNIIKTLFRIRNECLRAYCTASSKMSMLSEMWSGKNNMQLFKNIAYSQNRRISFMRQSIMIKT